MIEDPLGLVFRPREPTFGAVDLPVRLRVDERHRELEMFDGAVAGGEGSDQTEEQVEEYLDELEFLYKTYNIRNFAPVDDEFFIDKKRLVVIEPLATEYQKMKKCRLYSADEIYDKPGEELINDLENQFNSPE